MDAEFAELNRVADQMEGLVREYRRATEAELLRIVLKKNRALYGCMVRSLAKAVGVLFDDLMEHRANLATGACDFDLKSRDDNTSLLDQLAAEAEMPVHEYLNNQLGPEGELLTLAAAACG